MSEQPSIGWGIIGPGVIAKTFADALPHSRTGRLAAIASRNPDSRDSRTDFPARASMPAMRRSSATPKSRRSISRRHTRRTPNGRSGPPKQASTCSARSRSRCRRPRPRRWSAAARRAGTFLGEAFMYRLHPMTAKIVDLVKSKAVGELRMIRGSYRLQHDLQAGGQAFRQRHRRRRDPRCRLLPGVDGAASCRRRGGEAVPRPGQSVAASRISATTGADDWTSLTMAFPGGVIADAAASIGVAQENVLRVYGTEGWIAVKDLLVRERQGGRHRRDRDSPQGPRRPRRSRSTEKGWLYAFEIDAAGDAIRAGKQEFDPPGMTWADTLGNMRALDAWRKSVGLEYEFEKPRQSRIKIDGRPLASRSNPMPRRKLPAIDREASVLALGGANFETYTQAAILCDALLRGRRQCARQRLALRAWANATGCSAIGWPPAACATTSSSSARARTRRSAIPTSSRGSSPSRSTG